MHNIGPIDYFLIQVTLFFETIWHGICNLFHLVFIVLPFVGIKIALLLAVLKYARHTPIETETETETGFLFLDGAIVLGKIAGIILLFFILLYAH